MSKNLVHNIAQKFNQRHVENQTDTSGTTNIRTKQFTKSSTSMNSTSTITNIKQFSSFNEELMQKFKKINNTSVASNIQNEMVVQIPSNSGNTTIKSVENPLVTRKEFPQNGKTPVVPFTSNKTGNHFSVHKNNITKELSKSSEKPAVPKKQFSQKMKTFEIPSVSAHVQRKNQNFSKSTTEENMHSSISSKKPAVLNKDISRVLKNIEDASATTNMQTKQTISSLKPVVPKKNVPQMIKRNENLSQTLNKNSPTEAIQPSTVSSKPVVPKKDFPRNQKETAVFDKQTVEKQIDTVEIINQDNTLITSKIIQEMKEENQNIIPKDDNIEEIKESDTEFKTIDEVQNQVENIQQMLEDWQNTCEETKEDINEENKEAIEDHHVGNMTNNTLITSKIIQEMKEENQNIIPKDDNIEEIKESDTEFKTIDEVQNQVEKIQQMLEDWQNTCEETKEDINEENKEAIEDHRVGNMTNNTLGYSYISGRIRNPVQETSNEESRVFQMKSLEETQEIIGKSTQTNEDNHTDNIINNKAYLYMSKQSRSKLQEETSNEETKVFEENENLTETVDVFSNTVVGFKDVTTGTIEKHIPLSIDNSEYVDEEIKASTSETYTDDGTYESIDVTNGALTIINPHQDTEINKNALKTVSQIHFDHSKSSRDTFLSLQPNETITESSDVEKEQWLDLYASQQNLASNTYEKLEAIKQNIPLTEILEKYDKNTISWRKILEYMELNIINTLTSEKIDAQEAKLYLIRKELMYLDALNILNNHFISKLVLLISQNEFKIMFGNAKQVIECSQQLIKDLEDCWENSVLMPNFANVLCKNFQTTFNIYISYCESQTNFEKTLEHIISDRKRQFMEILDEIQKDPVCCGMHLHSYMLLPIQKIHRFPAMIENILQFLTPVDEEYHQFYNSLDHINHLLKKCTKAVKDREIWAKTMEFMNQLDFPKDVPVEQLGIHEKRQIIRSGEVDMLEFSNSLFGKKVIRKPVHLFLFNDLLVIARKK